MSSLGFGCGTSSSGTTNGGVLSQLVATGACDSHLTANPDTTFWRARVQKCTNYAYESILQSFNGSVTFGSEVNVTLNRTGDLLYWMYVVIHIPGIAAVAAASDNTLLRKCLSGANQFPWASSCNPCDDEPEVTACKTIHDPFVDELDDMDFDEFEDLDACSGLKKPYCNWVNEIGHAAICRAMFSIGGQHIDSVYSHYLHMWEELSGQPGKRLEEMVGKRMTRQQLVADSAKDRVLYVPIPFYFTRHSGNALPLVSLQFHSVQVHVSFTQLSKLIQVSDSDVTVVRCSTGQAITQNDIAAQLDVTYIYLDMEERDRFAVGSFQQLVSQVQHATYSGKQDHISTQLNFNHPCTEIIWAAQRKCASDANNTFDYSGPHNTDIFQSCTLKVNNLTRFCREATYFRLKVPYEVHTNIPKNFIYCYSFALQPESCQPSGSLNFSRIDNVEFSAQLQPGVADNGVNVIIFARNWNVLRFKEGLGGILFAN
jgi:hypothetical protein